jgi:hypothetical protein
MSETLPTIRRTTPLHRDDDELAGGNNTAPIWSIIASKKRVKAKQAATEN